MATEAVLETLRQLWLVLRQNSVVAAVVGGLALATWRHPRTTLDVDVLLIGEGAQFSNLLQNLLNSLAAQLNLTSALADIQREAFG